MSLGPRTEAAAIEVFAPAKVNLSLQVVGRRADGYHLLDSLVVFAGVGDSLRFAPGHGLSLMLGGPTAEGLAAESDNIILRAARKLAEAAGIAPDAAIGLTKRLPVAAGIGGGSADAAATLKGLRALWNLAVDDAELARIGLSLGADVPVCLYGRPARMTGVGEHLAPAPALPPAWLVLVNPRVALSTPAVFKARQAGFSTARPLETAPKDAAALAEALRDRPNDLTDPAVRLLPLVGEMLAALGSQPGCLLPRMSGSGATCFGLFGDQGSAEAAAARLRADHPAWWIAAAPVLTQVPAVQSVEVA